MAGTACTVPHPITVVEVPQQYSWPAGHCVTDTPCNVNNINKRTHYFFRDSCQTSLHLYYFCVQMLSETYRCHNSNINHTGSIRSAIGTSTGRNASATLPFIDLVITGVNNTKIVKQLQ